MDDIGHQLFRVQCGLDPDDWKPMASIGPGVREIRVRDPSGAFRTIYLATRSEAIYVLHCFRKKTPKTALQDIDLARQRLARVPKKAPHG
jgi:phage-related protein